MATNANLYKARKAKNDEFYTQLSDIENELRHYKQHFRGKIVFCNCDDPYESNFFKYFAMNFNSLRLKKLIATGYVISPVVVNELSLFEDETDIPKNQPYVVYINEVTDLNGDGRIDLEDVKILLKEKHNCRRKLYGDNKYPAGDFRSEESIALLKQADIVVTNPPFSLFREYIRQLVEYNKNFIVWGNTNAITYKEIFPLLKDNIIWLGYMANNTKVFQIPDSYTEWDKKITKQKNDGKKYCKVPSIAVFTNLDIQKRHEDIILYKKYNPNDYPKYINYEAIEVSKVSDIPCDYDDKMGVPITFLDKYNPKQFEILGTSLELAIPIKKVAEKGTYMNGGNSFYTQFITQKDIERGYKYHREYDRIVIRKRKSAVS